MWLSSSVVPVSRDCGYWVSTCKISCFGEAELLLPSLSSWLTVRRVLVFAVLDAYIKRGRRLQLAEISSLAKTRWGDVKEIDIYDIAAHFGKV